MFIILPFKNVWLITDAVKKYTGLNRKTKDKLLSGKFASAQPSNGPKMNCMPAGDWRAHLDKDDTWCWRGDNVFLNTLALEDHKNKTR